MQNTKNIDHQNKINTVVVGIVVVVLSHLIRFRYCGIYFSKVQSDPFLYIW